MVQALRRIPLYVCLALVAGLAAPHDADGATPKQPADSTAPAAGICPAPPVGRLLTIAFGIDTPHPRCAKAFPTQRLRLVNERPRAVRFSFLGKRYRLAPGRALTLGPRLGRVWEPGVHSMGPMGPEIWLVNSRRALLVEVHIVGRCRDQNGRLVITTAGHRRVASQHGTWSGGQSIGLVRLHGTPDGPLRLRLVDAVGRTLYQTNAFVRRPPHDAYGAHYEANLDCSSLPHRLAAPDTSLAPPTAKGSPLQPIMCGPGPNLPADAFSRLSGQWDWRDRDEALIVGRALTVVSPNDRARWINRVDVATEIVFKGNVPRRLRIFMPRAGIGGTSRLIAGQRYFFWLQKHVVREIFVHSDKPHRAAYGGDYCRPYFAVDDALIKRLIGTKAPIKRYRLPETSLAWNDVQSSGAIPLRAVLFGLGTALLLGGCIARLVVTPARRQTVVGPGK